VLSMIDQLKDLDYSSFYLTVSCKLVHFDVIWWTVNLLLRRSVG
jgi:hypothetical protein